MASNSDIKDFIPMIGLNWIKKLLGISIWKEEQFWVRREVDLIWKRSWMQ